MKKQIRLLTGIFSVLLILLGLILFGRGWILGCFLQNSIQNALGVRAELATPSVSWDFQHAEISELKLLNPPGYRGAILAEIKDVELECDWVPILAGREARCTLIRGRLHRLFLERHPQNRFNLKELRVFKTEVLSRVQPPKGFQTKRYEVILGKGQIAEFGASAEPQVTEMDFNNRKEVFGKISDPALLVFAPVLSLIPEFKRGNMGIPRAELQKRLLQAWTSNEGAAA